MKKKLLLLFALIAACIALVGLLTVSSSAATEGYYTYTVTVSNSNGEATITGVGTSISGGITIPSTLGGYPVTSIGDKAFYDCTDLRSVTIPDSVTSIGFSAFLGCKSLTSVTIPDSVTSIGEDAFWGCKSLTSVAFDENSALESIGSFAFMGCESLTSVTIPDSVTSIGSSAFCGCKSLTSVTIPDSVTSIGSSAFYNCTSLTSITIPESVTRIGSSAFSGCSALESITLPFVGANSDATGSSALFGYIFGTTSYTGGAATNQYYNDSNYTTTYYIPTSLKTVVITDATTIWRGAFHNCTRLTSITIPDSVTSIGSYAFRNCTGLTSITIPDSVTSIGSFAFYDCTNLTSITISDNVTSIGEDAFYNCKSLTSVTIPDSVTSIGSYAFYNCTDLTSITIPDSVTSIGKGAFSGCSALESITLPFVGANSDATGSSALFGYIFGTTSYTGGAATNQYYNGSNYTTYYIPRSLKTVVITDATTIGRGAFYNCTRLTSITIPDSVTSIGDYAFRDCTSLTSINIPDSVTSIGSYAFLGCTSLTSINIPDSVTSIGSYAFRNCTGLTSITIPDSVTSIGSYAFLGCTSLTSINIPDSVTSIGSYAFYDCTGLTSITIPDSVTSIGEDAFYNCTSLTSITIPNSVTSIGSAAFERCTSLESITLPFVGASPSATGYRSPFGYIFGYSTSSSSSSGYHYYEGEHYTYRIPASLKTVVITGGSSIGSLDFSGCTGLTSITLPNSVMSIGDHAFSGCTGLTSITLPDSVTSIGSYAFDNCTGLTSITIPDSVMSIGKDAFRGCTGLTSITLPFVGATVDGTSDTHFGYIFGAISSAYNSSYVPSSLKTVVITGGKSIDEKVFQNCKYLTSITIPESVTSIGKGAFSGCTGLTAVHITDLAAWCKILFSASSYNPLYYAENLYLNGTLVTDLVIPDGVTSIGNFAFYNCKSLKSVTIPDSVTSIGSSAFSHCTSLSSVNIPDRVTSIGKDAFSGCTGLASITVTSGNTKYHSARDCLIETESKTLVVGCKNSVIPGDGSVTSIGDSAFYNCTNLTSITIPKSVTCIGKGAFAGCAGLTSVAFDENSALESIGSSAFSGCTGLTSITLPDNVMSIGDHAFSGCTGLTSITISDSVTSIGSYAFYDCTGLTSITIPDSVTSIGSYAFSRCTNLTSITIPDSVTSISSCAFSGCTGLTSITIPDSVTSIGSYAFSGCTGLTSITIPDSVTSIGAYAFYGCTGLESITLPFVGASKGGTGNTYFGYIFGASSYQYNSSYVPTTLKTVVITGGTSIGSSAFEGCTGLTSITIPDSVTSIGKYAFRGCTGLESITLPFVGASKGGTGNTHFGYIFGASSYQDNSSYVPTTLKTVVITGGTNIGSSAFEGCTGLTSITIPDSVTSIEEDAFKGCTNIQTAKVPASAISYIPQTNLKNVVITGGTSIASSAFKNCKTLTSITILNSVTSIGADAFSGCTGLVSITIPNSVTRINSYAFLNCTDLTSITFSDSVTSIGYGAFEGCYNIQTVYYNGTATKYRSISFGNTSADPTYYGADLVCAKVAYTFLDEDGAELEKVTADYGTVIVAPADPTKAATQQYTYTFVGFEGFTEGMTLTEDVTFVAKYDATLNKYTYTFFDEDGVTVLGTATVDYGTKIVAPQNPVKQGTAQYSYPFAGWSGFAEGMTLTEDLTFTATYDTIINQYTYTFLDEDGAVLKRVTADYGTIIVAPELPKKPADSLYTYVCLGFEGFTYGGMQLVENVTFTATYSARSIYMYTVSDGKVTIDGIVVSMSGAVIIPSTIDGHPVEGIGHEAFYGCSEITSITIPDGVKCIEASAFLNCTSLISVTIPTSVTSIGNSAFSGCSNLTSVTIPVGVKSIGNYAFYGCSNLASATIPNSVTSIGHAAFLNCTRLSFIKIPDRVTSIGDLTFAGCTALASINIPDGVITIGEKTFRDCIGLTTIIIPASVKSIGDSAFSRCSSLETVSYHGTRAEWANLSANASVPNTVEIICMRCIYIFIDEDGMELKKMTADYGTTIVAPENPSKDKTQQYTYTFVGFEGYTEGMILTEDITFVAKYDVTVNKYTYTFLDEDGTELKKVTVEYGTEIVAPAVDSIVDKAYTYTPYFIRFTEGMVLTKDVSFTLAYVRTLNEYTYTFFDEDGVTVLKSAKANYGMVITAPEAPAKPDEGIYKYIFVGFEGFEEGMILTENISFKATYTAERNGVLTLESTDFHTAWGFDFVTSVTATQTAGTGGEFTLILDPLAATLLSFEAAEGVNVVQTGNTLTVTVDRTVEAGETLVTLTMTASDFLLVGETAFLSLEEAGAHTATFAPIVIFEMGDVNMDGTVNTVDALYVQQHAVGLRVLSAVQLAYAEAMVDGTINTVDALRIQQKAVGMAGVNLGERYTVSFATEPEKEIVFTVEKGNAFTQVPEAPEGCAWSESETEYIAPDFEAITQDKKYYLVEEEN